MQLEVCTGSLTSVVAACKGGADRVELCSALGEGGLTPSFGLMKSAISYAHSQGVKVNVLIRVRGGDFLYTKAEKAAMLDDIVLAEKLGADGVVVGALLSDGSVDEDYCEEMRMQAGCMEMTFHRAFDMCKEPLSALEKIASLGFDRLLTSGQCSTAEEGIDNIRSYVRLVGERMIIMPGCGVNHKNACRIVEETGVSEIHASARHEVCSKMEFQRGGVEMGGGVESEYVLKETSESEVKAIKTAIIEK